jgi:hypothetical protein
VAAGSVTHVAAGLVADAVGNQHAAYCLDGSTWVPLGEVRLAESEITSDVSVPAGTTQPIISVDASFAGLARTVEVTLSCPEIEFTAAPGGECFFSLTVASNTYTLGHMAVKGPFAWPARLSRQFPAPGAGSFTFAVSVTSVSQPVTLHADGGAAYGPIALSVAVVG